MIEERSIDETALIAALKIAASSGCAVRYSKKFAPWARSNAGWPVITVSCRLSHAFQRKGMPNIIAKFRIDSRVSLRNVELSGVCRNLPSRSSVHLQQDRQLQAWLRHEPPATP